MGRRKGGGASGNGTVFAIGNSTGALTTIWSFSGGSDGAIPGGPLLRDQTGTLYGNTLGGGNFTAPICGIFFTGGCGAVFKLTPPAGDKAGWSLSTLYAFTGGSDGGSPCPRSSPTGPGRFMEPRMPAAPVASPSRVAAS